MTPVVIPVQPEPTINPANVMSGSIRSTRLIVEVVVRTNAKPSESMRGTASEQELLECEGETESKARSRVRTRARTRVNSGATTGVRARTRERDQKRIKQGNGGQQQRERA